MIGIVLIYYTLGTIVTLFSLVVLSTELEKTPVGLWANGLTIREAMGVLIIWPVFWAIAVMAILWWLARGCWEALMSVFEH